MIAAGSAAVLLGRRSMEYPYSYAPFPMLKIEAVPHIHRCDVKRLRLNSTKEARWDLRYLKQRRRIVPHIVILWYLGSRWIESPTLKISM